MFSRYIDEGTELERHQNGRDHVASGCPSQGPQSVLPSSPLSCCLGSHAKSDKIVILSPLPEDPVCYVHKAPREECWKANIHGTGHGAPRATCPVT